MTEPKLSTLRWALHHYARHNPSLRRRLRFLARSLMNWRASHAWFHQLRQLQVGEWARTPSDWLEQAHRPFFDHRLSRDEVVRLLVHDAATQNALLGAARVRALLAGEDLLLARFQGKQAGYALTLCKDAQFSKEGTLCLCLREESGAIIKRMVFCFASLAGASALLIGCVQTTNNDPVGTLRRVTRDLSGMQPRLLLLDTLRSLAMRVGIQRIRGISKKNHVYGSSRYQHRGKQLPSYDELWELARGTRAQDGNFDIPVSIERKDVHEYPSHKRAEYRRRHEMLDAIGAQLAQSLSPEA